MGDGSECFCIFCDGSIDVEFVAVHRFRLVTYQLPEVVPQSW